MLSLSAVLRAEICRRNLLRSGGRMSETAIVKSVLEALEARGYFAWRVNSGSLVVSGLTAKRFFRGAPAGSPDIMVLINGGRLVGLEVKSATGTQRKSQATWQSRAESLGGHYRIVRSAHEALAYLASL
jgi:hypothetical protein